MDALRGLGYDPRLPLLLGGLLVLLVAAVVGGTWLYRHPQRGVLVLAALVPFDGLLLLVPHPGLVNGWKEALLLITALLALVSPRQPRPPGRTVPVWAMAVGALLLLAVVSALVVGGMRGLQGLKIGYFYLLIPLVLVRCPFDARERDRLVSIIMTTGVITGAYGLLQQVLGPQRLHALGYEYNTTIRTAGGFLRAFSSFVQPFPFGLYLMFVLLVGGAVALADPHRLRNAAFLLVTPLLVLAMATSIVRASYLGLIVGLAVLAWHRHWLLALAPLAVAAGLLLLPGDVLGTMFSSTSLGERGSGWEGLTDVVLNAPWGTGLASTGAAAEKVASVTGVANTGYQPDNYYFKTLIELGVLGVWLLLILIVSAYRWCIRVARSCTGQDSALALGIAASVAAMAAASTVATYLEIFPMDVMFWLSLGVVTCIPVVAPSGSTPLPSDPEEAASRPTYASSSAS